MSSVVGVVASNDFKIVDVWLSAVVIGVIKTLVVVTGVEVTISGIGAIVTEVLIDGVLIADKVVETVVENVDDDNNVRKTDDDVEALVVLGIAVVVI